MTGCSPIECGMEGLTIDVKGALIFDDLEAPTVDEVDAPSKLEGVPNMVETMALTEETVGVAPIERLGLPVFGVGITQTIYRVKVPMVLGLRLSSVLLKQYTENNTRA
jgi:hypothetical protein